MELRQLRYFVAIVEHGSFSKAANQLRVAQPALSQHLRHMEEELGITCALIPSNTKGVVLGLRHDPLGVPFYNCPTQGRDVCVPLEDTVIGGAAGAGEARGSVFSWGGSMSTDVIARSSIVGDRVVRLLRAHRFGAEGGIAALATAPSASIQKKRFMRSLPQVRVHRSGAPSPPPPLVGS